MLSEPCVSLWHLQPCTAMALLLNCACCEDVSLTEEKGRNKHRFAVWGHQLAEMVSHSEQDHSLEDVL